MSSRQSPAILLNNVENCLKTGKFLIFLAF
nr:MAG TPA: hypothetical protein [Caudoviricetes sp.]